MKNKNKKERKTPVIYVGNSIQNVLKKYSVFINGIPYQNTEIKNMIEKCTELEKLFIPVHELNEWEKRAKQKGTLEYMHLQNVNDYFF